MKKFEIQLDSFSGAEFKELYGLTGEFDGLVMGDGAGKFFVETPDSVPDNPKVDFSVEIAASAAKDQAAETAISDAVTNSTVLDSVEFQKLSPDEKIEALRVALSAVLAHQASMMKV